MPVSVIVPIKNEAENLPRCLGSIAWADEIFVVDSQSSDGSQAIAEEHGAQVVQFEFNGTWPKKKNWALENLPFRHDWVFILDADEVLPPEAEAEFRARSRTPGATVGYWINRRFMFMGRWLRHAYYPNWNLRLFRHSLGRYEKLTDVATASGDNEVHEHVVVQGPTGRLALRDGSLRFSLGRSVRRKTQSLFQLGSARRGRRTKRLRANCKARASRNGAGSSGSRSGCPFRPLLRFLYVYIWQRGFLDGREGYYFARLHAFYEFLSVAKTRELKKQSRP